MAFWTEEIPLSGVARVADRHGYAVHVAASFPERSSRLRVFFRLLLAVPAYLVTALFVWIAQMLAFVGWLVSVFSGEYDQTLWRFSVGCLRRMANLSCYLSLLRDEYPPFGDGRYPLRFEVAYQRRRSRLSAFFRWLLVSPQLLVLCFLSLPWTAAVAIAWFSILITGRYPRGLWLLVEGFNRWNLRVQAYSLLLTDEFPPYSLGLADSATPPDETAVAAALDTSEPTFTFAAPEFEFPAAAAWPQPTTPPPAPVDAEAPLSYVPPHPAADALTPGFFAFPPRPAAGEAEGPDRPDERD